ncbi:hypothetical protein TDB9533_02177 [Thalassocella blandensis]|nr:hypothetical protein TDB9533_02177 [Thalassocella blandensis]
MKIFTPFFLKCFCLLYALGIAACSITERVSYEDQEGQIPESVFEDIKQKKISTGEVVEQLGEPVLIEMLGDDIKVMTYRFNRVHIRNWRFLFVLHSGARSEDLSYFHVAYKNNEIKKTWIDDSLRIQKIHKLVQEVDPPKKEKSSGVNWKLPFFGNKNTARDQPETSNPGEAARSSAIPEKSAEVDSGDTHLPVQSEEADSSLNTENEAVINTTTDNETHDHNTRQPANEDALKVELTL